MSVEPEAITVEHRALAIPDTAPPPALFDDMRPAEKLAYAREVADSLRDMLEQGKIVINAKGEKERKPLIVRIPQKKDGRIVGYSEHVEVEGWLTCAMLCGATIVPRWTKPLEDEDEAGYAAYAEVVRRGMVVGGGEGHCDKGEYRWKSANNYAIKSMAQTRAQSKAGRSVFSWIMVLAGFSATPADEMPKEADAPPAEPKNTPPPTPDYDLDTETNRDHWRKQIVIGASNRNIPDPHRHEIAMKFFGQPSTDKAPKNGEPLTASQLHLLYRVLATYVRDRERTDRFIDSFDGWLDTTFSKWHT